MPVSVHLMCNFPVFVPSFNVQIEMESCQLVKCIPILCTLLEWMLVYFLSSVLHLQQTVKGYYVEVDLKIKCNRNILFTIFQFYRQGKILKLRVDGLTLKTETLASPNSRYDFSMILAYFVSVFSHLGFEGPSIILEALHQGQAMLQVPG